MTAENVIIRFVGEDNVSNVTSTIDKNMGALGGQAEAVSTKMSAFQGIAQGAFMAIGGALTNLAGAGLQQLGSFFTGAIAESSSWQSALAQTEAVVKSTGGAAGITATEMGKMAEALSAASGKSIFSDDAILGAQNVLATFTQIKGTNFGDATSAILDVSQALGQDLQSTSIQVGKALNDPVAGIGALSRVGVTFSEDQKAMIQSLVDTGDVAGAQQIIIAELNKEFGGSAAAAADTFAGRQARLAAQFDEVKQKVGDALLPVLGKLMDLFATKFMPYVESASTALADFIAGFDTDTAAVWVTELQTALATLVANFDTIKNAVTTFFEILMNSEAVTGLTAAFSGLVAGLTSIYESVMTVMPSLQNIFNNVFTVASAIIGSFGAAFGPLAAMIGEAIGTIIEAIVPISETITNTLASPAVLSAIDSIISVFGLLGQIIVLIVTPYILHIIEIFETRLLPVAILVFNGILAVINTVVPVIKSILEGFVLLLSGDTTGGLNKLGETFSTVWANIKLAVQGGVDYITTAIKTKIEEAKTLGTDLVKGIANGIDLGVQFVKDAIERVLGAALQKAREWGLIESPSRKFADMVGAPISQGMAQGIINSSGLVADASSAAVGNAAAVTTYNYNLNASYATVQNEGSIMQDMRAMQLLSGAV
jgi:phage-related protein